MYVLLTRALLIWSTSIISILDKLISTNQILKLLGLDPSQIPSSTIVVIVDGWDYSLTLEMSRRVVKHLCREAFWIQRCNLLPYHCQTLRSTSESFVQLQPSMNFSFLSSWILVHHFSFVFANYSLGRGETDSACFSSVHVDDSSKVCLV